MSMKTGLLGGLFLVSVLAVAFAALSAADDSCADCTYAYDLDCAEASGEGYQWNYSDGGGTNIGLLALNNFVYADRAADCDYVFRFPSGINELRIAVTGSDNMIDSRSALKLPSWTEISGTATGSKLSIAVSDRTCAISSDGYLSVTDCCLEVYADCSDSAGAVSCSTGFSASNSYLKLTVSGSSSDSYGIYVRNDGAGITLLGNSMVDANLCSPVRACLRSNDGIDISDSIVRSLRGTLAECVHGAISVSRAVYNGTSFEYVTDPDWGNVADSASFQSDVTKVLEPQDVSASSYVSEFCLSVGIDSPEKVAVGSSIVLLPITGMTGVDSPVLGAFGYVFTSGSSDIATVENERMSAVLTGVSDGNVRVYVRSALSDIVTLSHVEYRNSLITVGQGGVIEEPIPPYTWVAIGAIGLAAVGAIAYFLFGRKG